MPTVLHDIAWRAMQVHGALGTTNEMPFFGMIHGAGVMGLADGPTEVHKVTVARQVLRDYKASDDIWPTQWLPKRQEAAQGQVRPVPRAGGGEPVSTIEEAADTPTIADVDDADGLARRAGPRRRRAARARLHLGRQPERDLRAPAGRPALRHADPAAAARRASRDEGIVREWRIIEALTAPTSPTPRRSRVCTDQSVLGRTFYLMGFVDGWSPMSDAAPVAGALRHGPRGAPRSGLPAGRGHRPARQRRLAAPRASTTSGDPTASTSARSTAGPPSWSASRDASCPASTRPPRGCGRTDRSTTSRAHARRLPVRQRHVQARRAGAAGRHRRLGDGHRRRPQARPRLGRQLLARGHLRRRGPRRRLRRHDAACPRATRCWRTTPGLGPPGRRHRLLLRAGQVEAGRRARAGLPACRRRREAAGLRAHRARADAGSGGPGRDRPTTTVPASQHRAEVRAALCRTYGGPEVVELAEVPSPRSRSGPGPGARSTSAP